MSDVIDLEACCRETLTAWLVKNGFGEIAKVGPARVESLAGAVCLALSYYVEEPPPRSLMVSIGLVGPDGSRRMAGLWSLLPDDDPAIEYPTWSFRSQDELKRTVNRVRDEVLTRFVPGLLASPDAIVTAINRAEREAQERFQSDRSRQLLTRARAAFSKGLYADALADFGAAGSILSKVDEQRVRIARKRIAGDTGS